MKVYKHHGTLTVKLRETIVALTRFAGVLLEHQEKYGAQIRDDANAAKRLSDVYRMLNTNWDNMRANYNEIAKPEAKLKRMEGSIGTFIITTKNEETGKDEVFQKSMRDLAQLRTKLLEPFEESRLYLRENWSGKPD